MTEWSFPISCFLSKWACRKKRRIFKTGLSKEQNRKKALQLRENSLLYKTQAQKHRKTKTKPPQYKRDHLWALLLKKGGLRSYNFWTIIFNFEMIFHLWFFKDFLSNILILLLFLYFFLFYFIFFLTNGLEKELDYYI